MVSLLTSYYAFKDKIDILDLKKKYLKLFFSTYFPENENCSINTLWNFLNRKNVHFVLELY